MSASQMHPLERDLLNHLTAKFIDETTGMAIPVGSLFASYLRTLGRKEQADAVEVIVNSLLS